MTSNLMRFSDDSGRFRLSGLQPGAYVVSGSILLSTSSGPYGVSFQLLSVYAPGKIRKTEATNIRLHEGEERTDVHIVLPLSGMHTVSGHVGASDGERIMGGTAFLEDSVDYSLQRSGFIATDGSFRLQWVPAGTYTLKVHGGPKPMTPDSHSDGSEAFQEYQQSLSVTDGDLSGLDVNLSPSDNKHSH